MSIVFERITIIGMGLIGSSIARAARKYKLADTIIGYDHNAAALSYAHEHGFIDVSASDVKSSVAGSNLVVMATPPAEFETITMIMEPSLAAGSVVMDTASVKRMTMQSIESHLPAHCTFIPAHPIAGSQHAGVSAGRADLFDRCRVIVTPDKPVETAGLKLVTSFWQGMGARVEAMPPEVHDMIYAHISHLPHLLSFAARKIVAEDALNFPRLRDTFLRIGYSDPALWVELFYMNNDNIMQALNRYMDAIAHMRKELAEGPHDSPGEGNALQATNVLFPRIAAACLITTVMEAEQTTGLPFARFAGPGFADFTSPAADAPDNHISAISDNYVEVEKALDQYQRLLKRYTIMLKEEQYKELYQALTQ
ncbi:MAG: prephenate dehydrogenase/arogenate dehydrogenase family protein [Alphaproteobacteria bacterium]